MVSIGVNQQLSPPRGGRCKAIRIRNDANCSGTVVADHITRKWA
eukprot:SAG25_NODE_15012_length_189_cov_23.688889_1_plen_43_part_10